jgi:hypothetical protein
MEAIQTQGDELQAEAADPTPSPPTAPMSPITKDRRVVGKLTLPAEDEFFMRGARGMPPLVSLTEGNNGTAPKKPRR